MKVLTHSGTPSTQNLTKQKQLRPRRTIAKKLDDTHTTPTKQLDRNHVFAPQDIIPRLPPTRWQHTASTTPACVHRPRQTGKPTWPSTRQLTEQILTATTEFSTTLLPVTESNKGTWQILTLHVQRGSNAATRSPDADSKKVNCHHGDLRICVCMHATKVKQPHRQTWSTSKDIGIVNDTVLRDAVHVEFSHDRFAQENGQRHHACLPKQIARCARQIPWPQLTNSTAAAPCHQAAWQHGPITDAPGRQEAWQPDVRSALPRSLKEHIRWRSCGARIFHVIPIRDELERADILQSQVTALILRRASSCLKKYRPHRRSLLKATMLHTKLTCSIALSSREVQREAIATLSSPPVGHWQENDGCSAHPP